MAVSQPCLAASHYQVLGLPKELRSVHRLSQNLLKAAYRRALLRNHPDKAGSLHTPRTVNVNTSGLRENATFSIDEITQAYAILSNPQLRSEYDRELKLRESATAGSTFTETEKFRTGIEVVDLDDLDFDSDNGVWFRSCRCGDEQGFQIREEDLEEAVEDGELNVGCKGCSLWLKVLFGVVEEVQDEAPPNGGQD